MSGTHITFALQALLAVDISPHVPTPDQSTYYVLAPLRMHNGKPLEIQSYIEPCREIWSKVD